jgi:hypothetical protein
VQLEACIATAAATDVISCAVAAYTSLQHAFGAYYGLAASMVLSNGRQAFCAYTSANIKNSASYTSNLFSMIGEPPLLLP